jgi:aryl-alcohol dehydrogenase-like predicted oxidoreductase
MRKIRSGETDLQVSAIAFGAMSLTRERETAGKAAVHRAFELGINL